MTDTLFKAAGVSRGDGRDVKFHVSRDTKNKEMFVSMNGMTSFYFVELPTPMTKTDAAKHLAGLKYFEADTAAQDLFKLETEGPVVAVKAPKVPKAPKVTTPKAPPAAKVNAVQIMKNAAAPADEAAKAKRLETIKAIAAKRNK